MAISLGLGRGLAPAIYRAAAMLLQGVVANNRRQPRARRLLLFLLADDEEKRRAWEVLVGAADWDKALAMEPQPDEPVRDPTRNPWGIPNMREPDMLLTAEAGLLPEITGGPDALTELMAEAKRNKAEGKD